MRSTSCPRCEVHASRQAICHLSGIGYYDARAAERLARSRRRPSITLSLRQLTMFVSNRSVYGEHADHVATRKFGLIGTYLERGRERHFMLDGNHRAFAHLKRGRQFRVYVLSLEESNSVFLSKRVPTGKMFIR